MFLRSFFHSQLGTGRRSTWNRRLHRFLSKTAIQRGWWRWGYFLGIHSEHFYFVEGKYRYTLGFCRIQCQEFHWILISPPLKIHFIQQGFLNFLLSKYTVIKSENLSLCKEIIQWPIHTIHCINMCVFYLTYISECILLSFFFQFSLVEDFTL